MEKYENLGTVGEGSYGVVIKCKDKTNGNVVAIKKFLESENDRAVKKIAFREIKILKTLRHENLVNLIEVFRRNRRIYLVFEYIDQNLLEEIEKSKNGLGEERTREVMYQVVRGIDFMHSNNIIHRDIKPENILINSEGLVKLCDFGFARQIAQPNEVYTDYVATRWYRSPELLVGDPKYGKPVDIWSLGVLAYEVLTSRPLYPGESDLDQLFLIMNSIGDITDSMKQCFAKNQFYMNSKLPKIKNFSPLQNKLKKYSSNLVKFILDSLIIDPHKRYTSSELLQHSFFTENQWIDEFSIKLKKLVTNHESLINLNNRSIANQSILGKGENDSLKNLLLEKPKEVNNNNLQNDNKNSTNLISNQKQGSIQINTQPNSNPSLNQTKTNTNNSNINNFFNSNQNEEANLKANMNSNANQNNNQTNNQKNQTNQKFVKNVLIKPNFNLSNGKEIGNNNEYYTASFTSTVVNNSIKKFNFKKNQTKDNVVIDIKNSKILPKIENQQTGQLESPRNEPQNSNNKHQSNNQTNTNLTSLSFNLYKQQNLYNNASNQNNLTSFSNLSMRKSPITENILTNSSLSILNDMNMPSVKRSNSNSTIIYNTTNSNQNNNQNKSNNLFIDENFKLTKKPNHLTSSTSDINVTTSNTNTINHKVSISRQETINNNNHKNNQNNNVRLPQMKNFDKKKYNFKI